MVVGSVLRLLFLRKPLTFPSAPLRILTNLCRCWDGKTIDSPDHKSHVAYPSSGSFESTGPCPASHPVRLPQVMYEIMWDTREFNDKDLWPVDGSNPFVYSTGDPYVPFTSPHPLASPFLTCPGECLRSILVIDSSELLLISVPIGRVTAGTATTSSDGKTTNSSKLSMPDVVVTPAKH